MGAYCFVYNDTNEAMYMKYGANMNALARAGIAASIAAAIDTAGAAAPAVASTLRFTGSRELSLSSIPVSQVRLAPPSPFAVSVFEV
jgi:hypothetical protein